MRRVLMITGINPEPWTAPELSMERRGSKTYPRASKNPLLAAYQEAIRETVAEAYPDLYVSMFSDSDGPLRLMFQFWRKLDMYELPSGRQGKRKVADATNCQKATEDALQGILFKNDRQVKMVSTQIIAEGTDVEPFIVIQCAPWEGNARAEWLAEFEMQERPFPPGNVFYFEDDE